MPITWRNVGSTVNGGGGASLMEGAQESMTSGFDALQKVLDNRQKTNRKNYGTGQENMVADYLDRVAQASSVDDVGGLRGDAELKAMRDKLNGKYAGQVRGAVDERETDVIEQVGARQEFEDDQTGRGNRELLGRIANLTLNGQGDEAQELFQSNRGNFVNPSQVARDIFGDTVDVNTENRAQDRNARAWNDDARAAQDQQFQNYERARIRDSNDLNDKADGLLREAYQGAQELPEGMNMSDYKRATQDALVNAGVQPDRAATLAADLDGSVSAREEASMMDNNDFQSATSSIDRHYEINSNEFNQEMPSDPQATANTILRKFVNEDGELPGGSDPEERGEFAEEAGELMRRGVKVDGIEYPVTPALLEAAMSATGDVFWDDRPVRAMEQFIRRSPGIQQRYKDYQNWQADTGAMEESFVASTGSGYESEWSQQVDDILAKREAESRGEAMEAQSEEDALREAQESANRRIPFR